MFVLSGLFALDTQQKNNTYTQKESPVKSEKVLNKGKTLILTEK